MIQFYHVHHFFLGAAGDDCSGEAGGYLRKRGAYWRWDGRGIRIINYRGECAVIVQKENDTAFTVSELSYKVGDVVQGPRKVKWDLGGKGGTLGQAPLRNNSRTRISSRNVMKMRRMWYG